MSRNHVGFLTHEEKEIRKEILGNTVDLKRKMIEDMRKLNCFEKAKKETVQQWINENLKLKCYEILSDDDIVSHVYWL